MAKNKAAYKARPLENLHHVRQQERRDADASVNRLLDVFAQPTAGARGSIERALMDTISRLSVDQGSPEGDSTAMVLYGGRLPGRRSFFDEAVRVARDADMAHLETLILQSIAPADPTAPAPITGRATRSDPETMRRSFMEINADIGRVNAAFRGLGVVTQGHMRARAAQEMEMRAASRNFPIQSFGADMAAQLEQMSRAGMFVDFDTSFRRELYAEMYGAGPTTLKKMQVDRHPHPEAGKPVPLARGGRTLLGLTVEDTRQKDGSVARRPAIKKSK